jgi:hypothetical protein
VEVVHPHHHHPTEPAPQEIFVDLPDDGEAEEAAIEQRSLLVSFETQFRDEVARQFMVAERRATAKRVAEAQAAARSAAHRRNIEAARAAMAVNERHLNEHDRRGALAAVAEAQQRNESQYPLPS